jgi:hypothetical protein
MHLGHKKCTLVQESELPELASQGTRAGDVSNRKAYKLSLQAWTEMLARNSS